MVSRKLLHPAGSAKHPINPLPHSGNFGPVIILGEMRSKITKINQTCIIYKLPALFRVNAVRNLPASHLLMGSCNAIEVSNNKRWKALGHQPRNLGPKPPPLSILNICIHAGQELGATSLQEMTMITCRSHL